MTTKKSTKKTTEKKSLSKKNYEKFFGLIGKARVMALKLSKDNSYYPEVKRTFASIEKKLWKIGDDYPWGRIVD